MRVCESRVAAVWGDGLGATVRREGGAHHFAIEINNVLVILRSEVGAVPRVRCKEDEARRATAPLLYGSEVTAHTQLHGLLAEVVPDAWLGLGIGVRVRVIGLE